MHRTDVGRIALGGVTDLGVQALGHVSDGSTLRMTGILIVAISCATKRSTKWKVEEDTFDYYTQDRAGNVWYFGESTAEYVNGYIVSIDGTFIAGEEEAKPGIIMPAKPALGTTLRQEFAVDEAEELARYENRGGTLNTRFRRFQNVLETLTTTPLAPEAKENKYYAPNVGNVLTVNLVTGERAALVSVTP